MKFKTILSLCSMHFFAWIAVSALADSSSVNNPNYFPDQKSTAPTQRAGGVYSYLQLVLSTDNFAVETSWSIKDQKGNTVYAGSQYENNKRYIKDIHLPLGSYTFTIQDTQGDGLTAGENGSYSVIDGNGKVIAEGGDFTFLDSVNFTVSHSSGVEISDYTLCAKYGEGISYNKPIDVAYGGNGFYKYQFGVTEAFYNSEYFNYPHQTQTDLLGYCKTPPSDNAALEIKKISITQRRAKYWKTVTFEQPFTVPPIVVMGPPSNRDAEPTTVRVRRVTKTGFQFKLDEWDYLDGKHGKETLSYLAIEPGVHLRGGIQVVAGSVVGVDSWYRDVNFKADFDSYPIVLTQQVSDHDKRASLPRVRSTTRNGFEVFLFQQENTPWNHGKETINYVAISSDDGYLGRHKMQAEGFTKVSDKWHRVKFSSSFSNPKIFASIIDWNDSDPASLRYKLLRNNSVKLRIQEEQSEDDETAHASEKIGWVVFGD